MDQRKMEIVSPIIITGIPRSGTSLVSGCINICGAFGGNMVAGNHNNAKGFFENLRIRELDRKYLRDIGYDAKGQNPIPGNTKNLNIPSGRRSKVIEYIRQDGYNTGPWFFKVAKGPLIWPVWHYAFPNAKWIIVRRRSVDIVNSCLRTGFMNGYSDFDGWMGWVNTYENRFVEMIQSGLNVKQVWPERMIRGNYEQLYEVIDWLGLKWEQKEVIEFLDPKLWKTKVKEGLNV
jgi:hypothetical protein